MRVFRHTTLACLIAAVAIFSAVRLLAITQFETDVSTAINRGIEYLATAGAFNPPTGAGDGNSAAGEAAGLAMEALLEKRGSADPTLPALGYGNASPTDQGRLRNVAYYILDRVNERSFYAYGDGNFMFGLSSYALTGGPDKSVLRPVDAANDSLTIKQAMDMMVDRTLAYQHAGVANLSGGPYPANQQGYWCYGPGLGQASNCNDSSTTQFAVAGLAAAKTLYTSAASGDAPYADAGRAALITTALNLTKTAYENNSPSTGSNNGACNVLSATERGHGYRGLVELPSLQQTASGIYIQLFGGSNLNTVRVQNYMEWINNRYRYTDLDSLGNSWAGDSWAYYLWSSFKGMELIRQSGVLPTGTNLGPNSWGTLPAGACNQAHKNPASVAQPASFGGAAAGVYAAETPSQYFDYASEIIAHQCAAGSVGYFACGGPGGWDTWSHHTYQLLVLQRAVGGGCVDTDADGICDNVDNCPTIPNHGQENTFGDPKKGDACEAQSQLRLNAATAPSSATAGVSYVAVTGALWPAGNYTEADITVYFATDKCFGLVNQTSATATSLSTISGSTKRVTVLVPRNAALAINYVWIVGPTFASTTCSRVSVVGPPA